ncbi:hypothetical protein TNCV_3556431 [Trichonephila clavipes]|nr:hypothetical protein TNCV_3556431 [Trichonephila clavipes]
MFGYVLSYDTRTVDLRPSLPPPLLEKIWRVPLPNDVGVSGHPKMSWRSTGCSRSTSCPPGTREFVHIALNCIVVSFLHFVKFFSRMEM